MADDARTPAEASEDFDPYYIWLGIPPQERPINHYRLLGLSAFESNPEVIAAAADRQMGFIRTHQLGRHQRVSQSVLNEVANAKVCLLNAFKKAEYDQQLRLAMTPVLPAALPPDEPSSDTHSTPPFVVTPVTPARGAGIRKPDKMTWPTSLVICGLAIVLLVAAAKVVGVRSPDHASAGRPDAADRVNSPIESNERARELRAAALRARPSPQVTGEPTVARADDVWVFAPRRPATRRPEATNKLVVPVTNDETPLETPSNPPPPPKPVKRGFELTVRHDLLWGWSRAGSRTPSFEPIRYDDLLTVTLDGSHPEHGFFDVDGKAVRPEVTCTKWVQTDRAVVRRPPEIRFNGKAYDVAFHCPGDYVFYARVGTWHAIAKTEVRQIPGQKGMPASRWIAAMGMPDHKEGDGWQYRRLPGLRLLVAGDPGRLRDFVLVDRDATR